MILVSNYSWMKIQVLHSGWHKYSGGFFRAPDKKGSQRSFLVANPFRTGMLKNSYGDTFQARLAGNVPDLFANKVGADRLACIVLEEKHGCLRLTSDQIFMQDLMDQWMDLPEIRVSAFDG